MQNRREFCHGLVIASIASAFEACGGGSSTGPSTLPALTAVSAAVSAGKINLNVDSNSPLSAVGSAAVVQTPSGSFLIARTAQSSFTALTAVCTHEGCTIDEYQSGTYECSCHGSQFSTSGSVVRGPAASPLRQFATSYASPTLTIAVA